MMALVIATDHALVVALAVFGLQLRERASRQDVSRFGAAVLASIGFAVVLLPAPISAISAHHPVAADGAQPASRQDVVTGPSWLETPRALAVDRDFDFLCPLVRTGADTSTRPTVDAGEAAGR
jgi:hypothetical protein